MTLVVGVLSGTSADGIDVGLFENPRRAARLVAARTYSYKPMTARRIRDFRALRAAEVAELHRDIGEEFASAINSLLRSARARPEKVAVIGSHGQTIFHIPGRMSLQLGAPAVIAARTGIPVAADFRVDDIAVGGDGAPLVPVLDALLLEKRSRGRSVAALNIGGIANMTAVRDGGILAAYDIGPGNCLVDRAMRRYFGRAYDRGGATARSGGVIPALSRGVLAHRFFRKKPPRTTGVEEFGDEFLTAALRRSVRRAAPRDIIATLTRVTATLIAREARRFALSELWVSGGGAKNGFLMELVSRELPKIRVEDSSGLGVDPDFKEALLFALLGEMRLKGVAADLRGATGASRPKVLGGLWIP